MFVFSISFSYGPYLFPARVVVKGKSRSILERYALQWRELFIHTLRELCVCIFRLFHQKIISIFIFERFPWIYILWKIYVGSFKESLDRKERGQYWNLEDFNGGRFFSPFYLKIESHSVCHEFLRRRNAGFRTIHTYEETINFLCM